MGLKVFASFIVSPNYVESDFTQLIRFIERNKVEYPSFTILTPLPGTDQFSEQYKNITEFKSDGIPDWEQWDLQHLVVPSLLPRDAFYRQYGRLRAHFRGASERYQRNSNPSIIRISNVLSYFLDTIFVNLKKDRFYLLLINFHVFLQSFLLFVHSLLKLIIVIEV